MAVCRTDVIHVMYLAYIVSFNLLIVLSFYSYHTTYYCTHETAVYVVAFLTIVFYILTARMISYCEIVSLPYNYIRTQALVRNC